MKKKILITGIRGFVGQNLNEYFKGKMVVGISRMSSIKEDIISYDDVFDYLSQSYVLIHLAGKAHDLKKTSSESKYFEVNTELTINLFDQFLASNCKIFIYMSSVKAVADKVDGFLEEKVIPNPVTIYGKSKLAAEQYILNQKLPKNKKVYILRPCMIHGANNKGNLNLLYNFVSKGIPYPFGKYENKRSFVSIENLCFIINELLLNNKIKSGVYNIADDATLSTKELVSIIGEITNKPVKILNLPKSIVRLVSKFGDIFPIPINSQRVQKLTENYCVTNKKIKNAIGKELPLTAKEGIMKTLKSFL